MDRSSSQDSPYLRISTTTGLGITLSSNHAMFRVSSTGAVEAVYAEEVVVGDRVVQRSGQGVQVRATTCS